MSVRALGRTSFEAGSTRWGRLTCALLLGLVQLGSSAWAGAAAATTDGPLELLWDDRTLEASNAGVYLTPSPPFADFDEAWAMGSANTFQISSVSTHAVMGSGMAQGSDGSQPPDIWTPDSVLLIGFRLAEPTRVSLSGWLTKANTLPMTSLATSSAVLRQATAPYATYYDASLDLFELQREIDFEIVLPPGDYEIGAVAVGEFGGLGTYQLEMTAELVQAVPVFTGLGYGLLVSAFVATGFGGGRRRIA